MDKPTPKKINDVTINGTKKAIEHTCFAEESNTRTDGTSEALDVHNKDLNRKYDDLLFEKRGTFSDGAESDEYRVSSSKEAEL